MKTRLPTHSTSMPDRLEVEGGHGKYTSLGYRSAQVATRDGRSYSDGSADLHLEYDRPNLIRQSRAFYRDNSIYRGIIDRAVSYIVGRGFGLRVLTVPAEQGQAIELAWRKWLRRHDIRGLLNGPRAAAMVCREAMICGDTGAIKREEALVQYVEAEQITDGKQSHPGIQFDPDGKPTTFSICPYGKSGRIAGTSKKEVPAEDFLFFTTPGRPSQTRGEPALQSAFAMLHRINDVCDSEALAWQLLSRLAISVTREDGPEKAVTESIIDPDKAASDSSGDVATRMIELDYAIVFHGKAGEKVGGIERNIPGANFTESLRTFLRLLGLPIGMPLELILLDWSQANYSQSRAVLEQAYQTFSDWQQGMEDFYYEPLFRWILPNLLQGAKIQIDPATLEAEWIKASFPWIDQLKEAQAHSTKLDRCMTLHAHVLKELNLDRETVVKSRVAEITDAINRAKAIEAETGEKVAWQLFCGLDTPKPTITPAERPATSDDQDDEDQTGDEESEEDKENTDAEE